MFGAARCTVVGFSLFAALVMITMPAAHGGVVLGILPLATAVAAAVLPMNGQALVFGWRAPQARSSSWRSSFVEPLVHMLQDYRRHAGPPFDLASTDILTFTQTGVGTCAMCPVGRSFPVRASMRNVTIVSVSWLAASKNLPVGSIPKLRGVFPGSVGYRHTSICRCVNSPDRSQCCRDLDWKRKRTCPTERPARPRRCSRHKTLPGGWRQFAALGTSRSCHRKAESPLWS